MINFVYGGLTTISFAQRVSSVDHRSLSGFHSIERGPDKPINAPIAHPMQFNQRIDGKYLFVLHYISDIALVY